MTTASLPAELTEFAGQVTGRLQVLADSLPEQLRSPVSALAGRPGKLLRAMLLGACAGLGTGQPGGQGPSGQSGQSVRLGRAERLVRLGALVELLHLASLLHDDVVDRAATRRGGPAAHTVVGQERAVLAGLACFALAGMEAAAIGGGLDQLVGRAVSGLACGEMLDVERAFDTALSVPDYLELAERKTGDLFRLSCLLGAAEAGAGQDVTRVLARFGGDLGVAFQVLDDCLDLRADETGKPAGTDHVMGLFGAPTLYALAADGSGELARILLSPGFSVPDMPAVRALVSSNGGLAAAAALARERYDMALAALDELASQGTRAALVAVTEIVWPGPGPGMAARDSHRAAGENRRAAGDGAAQPVTGAAQPVTGAAQPVTGAAQPVTGAAQPVTGAAQPVTGAAQPVTARRRVDVLVVGAGPAGAVTAAALARAGLSVLLADGRASGEEDHDVLVSGQAMRSLAGFAGPAPVRFRPIRVIRLGFGRAAGRSITDAGAAACGRAQLGDGLRRVAAAAGAARVTGWVTSIERAADCFDAVVTDPGSGTASLRVTARHVVAATGQAMGAAAGQAERGLPGADGAPGSIGTACARRFAGVSLRGRMLLVMTAPAVIGPEAPPSCAWAIAGGNGTVTVGAARSGAHAQTDPEYLLGTAVRTLAAADPRFGAITPTGPLVSGPLDAGFTPERVAAADHLLVGDAAGLVNPFTGEGLSYAVLSGLLAARSIAEQPSDPEAARLAYARRLSARFVGYFETARHASRRYHLTWRVLGAAASSDHPFFAKASRAILLPEGLTGIAPADQLALAGPDRIVLAPFLAACDEVVVSTIRTQWPFLARLMMTEGAAPQQRLRPAVLLLAGLMADGTKPDIRRASVGASVELAQLGALSFLGPAPSPRPPGRGVDWAAATAVLAGDFLLAQASRLVAESESGISWSFAEWLGELAALRAARLDPACQDVPPEAVFASLFEFPARIGGLLGGCSAETVQALRDVGHYCGHAFLHAEDILALRGERTRLDTTLQAMLRGRISAIPDCMGAQPAGGRLTVGPRLRPVALAAAAQACLAARRSALQAADAIPSPAAARILRQLVSAVAAPAAAAGGPADSHAAHTEFSAVAKTVPI